MSHCLLTFHDKNFEELANITLFQNKIKYAELHGYDCVYKTEGFSKKIGFDKLYCLDSLFKTNKYEWILWTDADAMITNFSIKLEDLIDNNFHFIVATDFNGINTGVFLIRYSDQGRKFLDYLIEFSRKHPDVRMQEQQFIKEAYEKTDFKQIIKIVPQKTMNSYMYDLYQSRYSSTPNCRNRVDSLGNNGDWQVGDFIVHLPDISQKTRIDIAKQMLDLIKY